MPTPFDIVTFAIGTAFDITGLIFDIVGAANGDEPEGGDSGLSQEVLDKLDALQTSLDSLRSDLSEVIVEQVEGLRQQSLLSAVSRAQSARDLLASVDGSTAVDASEIIADASRAFRDTLAQATEIITPKGGFQPSVDLIQTAFSAVTFAIGVRLEVAAKLERGDIGSDKINNQVKAAADFAGLVAPAIRSALTVSTEIVDGDTAKVTLNGAEFLLETIFDGEGSLDIIGPLTQDINFPRGAGGTLQPTFIGGVQIFPIQTSGGTLIRLGAGAVAPIEQLLENQALQRLGFGAAGADLAAISANYRELADGVEKVLPTVPGGDSSGVLVGTDGNDLLIGNSGDDLLQGLGGGDILRGRGGDDRLEGGDGPDRLEGDEGDDSLFGGEGDDALVAGPGDDLIDGGPGQDRALYASSRADNDVSVQDGVLTVEGPDGRDSLTGVERIIFDDATLAVIENDDATVSTLLFASNADGVTGSVIIGGPLDVLAGGSGDDVLVAGGPRSTVIPGGGDNVLRTAGAATFGATVILDGPDPLSVGMLSMPDAETFLFSGPDGSNRLDLGFDRVTTAVDDPGISFVYGGAGDDALVGGDGPTIFHSEGGADTMTGGADIDYFYAAGFDDVIDGGEGRGDTVRLFGEITDYSYSYEGRDVLVRPVGAPFASASRYRNIEFIEFDSGRARVAQSTDDPNGFFTSATSGASFGYDNWIVFGYGGDDTFLTEGPSHVFFGGDDDDVLTGGPGDDIISGDAGDDVLTGGGGANKFIFEVNDLGPDAGGHGVDRLTDFAPGVDSIVLRGNAFRQVANGVEDRDIALNFDPNEPEDVIFIRGETLHVDPDGNGPIAPIAFAELAQASRLKASDFIVEFDPASLPPRDEPQEPETPGPDQRPVIVGKETGIEVLQGTELSEVFVSRGGVLDTMVGGLGADSFVFGAEALDGRRERDVIRDYEVGIDEIVLTDGVEVKQITASDGLVTVFLQGDGDIIQVRGDGVSAINLTFRIDSDFDFAIA